MSNAILESILPEKLRGRKGEPKVRSRAPGNCDFPMADLLIITEASNVVFIRWENKRLCIIST